MTRCSYRVKDCPLHKCLQCKDLNYITYGAEGLALRFSLSFAPLAFWLRSNETRGHPNTKASGRGACTQDPGMDAGVSKASG